MTLAATVDCRVPLVLRCTCIRQSLARLTEEVWGRIGKFNKRLGEDVEGGEDWELCLQYCTGTLPRTSVWFDLFKIEPSAESRDI